MSCHSILEFEEVKLLKELGHKVFSYGAYTTFRNPGDDMRPVLDYDDDFPEMIGPATMISKDMLTNKFIEPFDVIIVMHIPNWVVRNWDVIKQKKVVWRTIGQSGSHTEVSLRKARDEGLNIVRYSPMERTIGGFIGEDVIIRFYKDATEFGRWNGEKKRVMSCCQNLTERKRACNFKIYSSVIQGFESVIYGSNKNVELPNAAGRVSYDKLLSEYRDNRVYFYTGTHPASYTLNFMEAFMTGIPVVAIGPGNGNAFYIPGCENLYEIKNLIVDGENGFISDDVSVLRERIEMLLNDHEEAIRIGRAGRKTAIELFDKNVIKKQWEMFLGGLK
jgi:hypothetical protein|tara:strand:- start:4670 stop:5668 length:999 start_codon:yes stop_codon:yes gene_type:complete